MNLKRHQFSRTMHYTNYKKIHTETARNANIEQSLYAGRVNEKHPNKFTPVN